MVVLRRCSGNENWPDVLIKDVTIDLDKYPFLSLRVRDDVGMPARFGLRVTDKESGLMLPLLYKSDAGYLSFDLRKRSGISGVRVFDLRLSYNGIVKWVDSLTNVEAKAGDYFVLDFIRFEQE